MIFSVSDKGGLEEKKFCPMYYQAQIRSYISTAVPSHFHKEPTIVPGSYPHIYKQNKENDK